MQIHKDLIQGSEEWKVKKLGYFSASNASNLFSKPSTQAYQDLINNVVAGRCFGVLQESYSNAAMEWGNTYEPFARNWYELETFNIVDEVGFIELNDFVGMSPDGLIGDDGLIEIKCPQLNTHTGYLINKVIPKKYYWQMQFQMYVSHRHWCDFLSFYPDENVPNWLERVYRNESDLDKIHESLTKCIEIAKQRIEVLK